MANLADALSKAVSQAADCPEWLVQAASKKPKRNAHQRRRDHLMAIDPHCANCGVRVVYYRVQIGETLPGNFATLEHVNSRNQSVPRPEVGRLELWCLRCNNERGAAEQAALGIEELHRRSGRTGEEAS